LRSPVIDITAWNRNYINYKCEKLKIRMVYPQETEVEMKGSVMKKLCAFGGKGFLGKKVF